MFAVLLLNNNINKSNSMPKKERKIIFIDTKLSERCKLLLQTADKKAVATAVNMSVGYVDMVINQTRYNIKVEKQLIKKCEEVLKRITK